SMQKHFYATADDLLSVLVGVEGKHVLAYTLTGLFESPELLTFSAGAELPTLRAPAPQASATGCPTYLVTQANAIVHTREAPQHNGGMCYAVDQLINPHSITLSHGGLFRLDILLSGRVSTASESAVSKTLYRAFTAAIAKQFVRIR